jgi:hypothetical protein
VVTLYVTPVVYTYLDALQHRLSRRAGAPSLMAAPEPAPAD